VTAAANGATLSVEKAKHRRRRGRGRGRGQGRGGRRGRGRGGGRGGEGDERALWSPLQACSAIGHSAIGCSALGSLSATPQEEAGEEAEAEQGVPGVRALGFSSSEGASGGASIDSSFRLFSIARVFIFRFFLTRRDD